jgi:hypothetical protein
MNTSHPAWWGLAALGALLALATTILWRTRQRARRAEFVRHYAFPQGLVARLLKAYPTLRARDAHLVAQGLRQFFLAYQSGGYRFVSMPSQVADAFWHEFILHTRHYDAFCRQAFGRFLHHTPAVELSQHRQNNTGLRRVWWHCCKQENIPPARPSRLPLLFALDAKFNIADGFRYSPDCSALRNNNQAGTVQCGADFSSDGAGGDSGSGFSFDALDGSGEGGGTDGGSGDGSGDGGGCGGGCGGGD